jgi:hypothetical protein
MTEIGYSPRRIRPLADLMLELRRVELMSKRIRGVLAPVVTPFKADLAPDSQRFIAQPTKEELKRKN